MKDVLENRAKRIEDLLTKERTACMVATKDKEGIHWNGNIYPDETVLEEAMYLTACDYDNKPLVIISSIKLSGKNRKSM
ncbi:MAG: hypothetical protein ABFD75_06215 [Smithella sp.]